MTSIRKVGQATQESGYSIMLFSGVDWVHVIEFD
ncbi:hypothetical protein MITS9509_01994 [Synechococcus sp. MIT S9509]|nr:hypothetical protein MITS9509_01994 [Synechococcus sp. MIT S9509]